MQFRVEMPRYGISRPAEHIKSMPEMNEASQTDMNKEERKNNEIEMKSGWNERENEDFFLRKIKI